MTAQFDLEQQILECWRVTEDIDMLYSAVMDTSMSRDDIANILLGLKTLYNLKFDRTFKTYETLLSDYYQARRSAETAYEPVVDSTTAD